MDRDLTRKVVALDQVILNGTSIDAMQVIRENLNVRIDGIEAGYHTLGLTIERGATNSRAIYQFVDNLQLTPITTPLQAVP